MDRRGRAGRPAGCARGGGACHCDRGAEDEYFTKDRASGLLTHGFMSRNGASEEVALSRLRRRLGYLRDKFLEDLAAWE